MRSAALVLLALATCVAASCSTDIDCSLNGVCSAEGVCACDSPWTGTQCEILLTAVTPAGATNVWVGPNTNASLNTWNGPIVRGPDGMYHLYDPVYDHASLWSTLYTAHGVSSSPTGPFDWTAFPNLPVHDINPAALVYPNASSSSGSTTAIFLGGQIMIADSPDGPFTVTGWSYPGGGGSNPAPIVGRDGMLYLTNQGTDTVWTTASLDKPWTTFSTIPHPAGLPYTVEDPVLWLDPRGRWHIINHAYNTGERTNCTTSHVSHHFFSVDGKTWGWSPQPYGHVVNFDNGDWHSFCTLERPNLVFDAAGLITHINFAADLVTGNEGCAARGKGCVDCKYDDHAGTLVVVLGVQ
jgi:hypothetical protein